MQGGTEVWEWSAAFLDAVVSWIEKPPAAAAARPDWMKQKLRLALWRREVEKARVMYPERPQNLRSLHGRWQAIAPTASDQVRLACETYHEFQRLLSD